MHSAIAWFTRNPVAANLLMAVLLVGGLLAMLTVHQEEFPNINTQVVSITVPYLGAAPEESEQGVCLRIEDAIEGVEGIDKIHATAAEGACNVMAELDLEADANEALNEIKSRVDGINSFPAETEKPIVSKLVITRGVAQIAISGDVDERTLKEIGKEVRDDIAAMSGISQVSLTYVRPYEIAIEVSEYVLRRYGLTLDAVAQAVRTASLDMPGGTIRTEGGEILIRTKGQAYWGAEFEDIVVLTRADGTKVTLSEVATIRDAFEEGDLRARFNGKPAVVVKVFQVGQEDTIQMARDVRAYVNEYQTLLPPGIDLTVWTDESKQLTERLDTLTNTALSGLVLVVIILALFLRFRLAMWVAAGIPIALFGTLAVFPYADISISTITVMAFILVLGILVDDAIVVGERVYGHEQMGKPPVQAAIDGAWEVSIPVIFGVLTTMAAFLPLIIVPGRMAEFFGVIGYVVIIALVFSIIESQLILPAHLAHRNHSEPSHGLSRRWNTLQGRLSGWLEGVARDHYRPWLERAVTWRYATAATGLGVLILAVALIASGRVIFGFFPAVEGDRIYAQLEMPDGTAVDVTARAAERLEVAADALREELDERVAPEGGSVIVNMLSSIGTLVERDGPGRGDTTGKSHLAEVVIELRPLAERDNLSAKEVAARWRALTGDIPDAVKLTFNADAFSAGEPINYQISGKNVDRMSAAAAELRAELSRYEGVFDIADSFRPGKQEIKLSLLPEARNLGLTLNDLARQVRNAFYGAEAQRIQRGQDEVRVMVRFPESERTSIGNLEDMYIRTPDGSEVPFYSVASFEIGRGFASIRRTDGRRVVNVTADVDRARVSPEEVNASIQREVLPKLMDKYRGIDISLSGEQEERVKAMTGLAFAALLALVIIYALLAIPLRSYVQPLVIMSVIPFGAVGAIVGHWVMGELLVFFSALGIVALSGVVVNSSLVLVDYVNRRRREGVDIVDALLEAGVVRFRPILLTSVTTFVGLIPLMASATPATAFVIPMAVSLAFGVLFATFITLFLVPALYHIAEDVFGWDAVAQGMAAEQG
ncbi:MAG: cobalt-zinc-cadmium resistance protein [Gammaproteobacteria bacterium]|nr:cobalt-zinc-cadmium resistance protein [Gammaproteobacteria bacterium]MBK80944.1 cobalt-zinc-cadmium resistance protein [Gammaproteobacteria bacterium]